MAWLNATPFWQGPGGRYKLLATGRIISKPGAVMRYWLVLVLAALAGCSTASASKIDERTFRIQGPEVPGGSNTPDARLAERICPHGYRVLSADSHVGGSGSQADRGANADPESNGIETNWTIRCL